MPKQHHPTSSNMDFLKIGYPFASTLVMSFKFIMFLYLLALYHCKAHHPTASKLAPVCCLLSHLLKQFHQLLRNFQRHSTGHWPQGRLPNVGNSPIWRVGRDIWWYLMIFDDIWNHQWIDGVHSSLKNSVFGPSFLHLNRWPSWTEPLLCDSSCLCLRSQVDKRILAGKSYERRLDKWY